MSNWKDFKQPNLGWLYNKRIYTEQSVASSITYDHDSDTFKSDADLDRYYNDLLEIKCDSSSVANNSNILKDVPGFRSFYGEVSYPGLLIGTGYSHGIKNEKDYKLGMSFDHTTGLPIIPGSSIKGIIRNFFESDIDFDIDRNSQKEYTGTQSEDQVIALLNEITNREVSLPRERVKELKERIFGSSGSDGSKGDDIFLDAVVDCERSKKARSVLGLDYITPHKHLTDHKLDAYSNPTPIRLMKVMPGVVFKFGFILKEDELLNVAIKEKIYQEILFMNGIGAKTSTGYGYLDVNSEKIISRPFKNLFPDNIKKFLIKNAKFSGNIIDYKNDYFLISFEVNGVECLFRKKQSDKFTAKVGDCVQVLCSNDYTDENPNLQIKLRN